MTKATQPSHYMKAIMDCNYVSLGACLSFAQKKHMESEGQGKRLSYLCQSFERQRQSRNREVHSAVFLKSPIWLATTVLLYNGCIYHFKNYAFRAILLSFWMKLASSTPRICPHEFAHARPIQPSSTMSILRMCGFLALIQALSTASDSNASCSTPWRYCGSSGKS